MGNNIRKSIATVTLNGSLTEKLDAAARSGFDGIELMRYDIGTYSPREVKLMADDRDIKIDVLQPFREMEGIPSEHHVKNLQELNGTFDLMSDLGAELMLICSNASPSAIDDDTLSMEQLSEIAEKASSYGIKIGFEALSWGTFINRDFQAAALIKRASHQSLGIVLDSFHSLAPNLDKRFELAPDIPIFYVQLSDAPVVDEIGLLEWSRHYRCLPGRGKLPLDDFVQLIHSRGYRGTYSIEIFSDYLKTVRSEVIAFEAMSTLQNFEHLLRTELD